MDTRLIDASRYTCAADTRGGEKTKIEIRLHDILL